MPSTKAVGKKFKFQKKDGTWSKKSFVTKGAAMSARRGSRGGGGGGKAAPSSGGGNNKWGWGRWAKMARTIDVVSGPAQGAVSAHGFTMEAGMSAKSRYTAGLDEERFDAPTAKATYGGVGTGLARDYARSKMGVYRGVGQHKLLSLVMASNPELLAASAVSPLDDFDAWNAVRQKHDRAYDPQAHVWDLKPDSDPGRRFWQSLGMDALLRGVQHILFDTTGPIKLNNLLPKGWNA